MARFHNARLLAGGRLSLLAALVCSCASSDHFYLGERSVSCSTGKAIEFLPEPPSRSFTELAHIETGQILFLWTQWETLRKRLCARAARLGADAVILTTRDYHPYDIGFLPFGIAGSNKKLIGTAIIYDDGESPGASENLEVPAPAD